MRVVLASLIILLGCRQKAEQSVAATASASPAANVPASSDSTQSSETPPTREPVNSAASAPVATAADLAGLTQALRKYSFEKQRVPKAFDEIVAAGYVKEMPQAPPGRKFGIDPKTVQVVLVKR